MFVPQIECHRGVLQWHRGLHVHWPHGGHDDDDEEDDDDDDEDDYTFTAWFPPTLPPLPFSSPLEFSSAKNFYLLIIYVFTY